MKNIFKKFLYVTVIGILCFVSSFKNVYAGGGAEERPHLSLTAYVAGLPEHVLELLKKGKTLKMKIIYSWHQELNFDSDSLVTYRPEDTMNVCCRNSGDKLQYRMTCLDFESEAIPVVLSFPCGEESTKFLEAVNIVHAENFVSAESPFFCYLKITEKLYTMVRQIFPCTLTFPLKETVILTITAYPESSFYSSVTVGALKRGDQLDAKINICDSQVMSSFSGTSRRTVYIVEAICSSAENGTQCTLVSPKTGVALSFPYDQKAARFVADAGSERTEKRYSFRLGCGKDEFLCSVCLPLKAFIK